MKRKLQGLYLCFDKWRRDATGLAWRQTRDGHARQACSSRPGFCIPLPVREKICGFPKIRDTIVGFPFHAATGRKRAPGGAAGMQQCGIFCSARSPGGRAGSRKNCEKNPANCAAAVVSRARRRLSMRGVAYSAGRAVIFSMTVWTCSLRGTQRQSHTDTQRHAHRLSWSQLQPGIVRVRVAKVFWAMAQLPHASLSVQCKRPQHSVESGFLSEPLS